MIEMEYLKKFKSEKGELNAIIAIEDYEIDEISDSFAMNSDISESKLDLIFDYLREHNLKVGFISSFEVSEEYRGQGAGRELMNLFNEQVAKTTDIDLLFARNNNKQKEGFNLEDFYKRNGFKSVFLESGDILMVTKGYEKIFDKLLNLKEERKRIVEYFDNNPPEDEDMVKLLEFTKKMQIERNDLKPKRRNKFKR
jgi:ribosomal protein S18 acetylase RimI-like enzyme